MNLNGINQIGIVGGGVSALMLCIEAAKLGIRTSLLDPKVNCVGSQIATEHIISTITNESIQKLSLRCDVVVFNKRLDFELDTKLHAKSYPTKDMMNDLANTKNILDILELLEIPTATSYYQDNKKATFDAIEHLELPFRFIKEYNGFSEMLEVKTPEDIADFILETDEEADGFIIQTIPSYKQTITCVCIVDEQGKVVLYDPLEEVYEEDKVCSLQIPDNLSKTMVQKIARYNRKLLKELNALGAFTIKYGIKANKSVDFISITPELSVASLLTLDAYDISIYEQYIHLLLGMKVLAPTLQSYVKGTVKEIEAETNKDQPYHLYNLGLTNLCITKEKKE